MLKNLVIATDLDNTVAAFTKQFVKYVELLGYKLDKNYASQWHIEKSIIGLAEDKQAQVIDDILSMDDFWLEMEPLPYTTKYLEWMNNKYNLYIVTTPWRFTDKYYATKLEWIHKYLPYINRKQVIFNSEKQDLPIDAIIDDKPATLEKCRENDIVTIAYDWPYNRNTKVDFRLEHWFNIPYIMKKIEEVKIYYD